MVDEKGVSVLEALTKAIKACDFVSGVSRAERSP